MAFSAQFSKTGEIGQPALHMPKSDGHKYHRGHAFVISGPRHRTGAARLAACAALRTGAGLVTIIGNADALNEHAAHVTAIMLREEDAQFRVIGGRTNAVAIGPAAGVNDETCTRVLRLLALGMPTVLDADAMTSFEGTPDRLFSALHHKAVLTPHEGEFRRLFPDIDLADRADAVRQAARRANAIVLLKGPETQIASPQGRWAINRNASPWLATAGSGDVLTGIVTGLLAQQSPAFEAAAMAAWLHGEIAKRSGAGLTADDMPGLIPSVLRDLPLA